MARIFISLILSLWAGLAYADQTSIIIPESQNAFNAQFGTSGQVTFGPLASRALNPALKTIASNFAGSTCSGIASPVPWQWCIDTTARTARLNTSDSGGNFAFHDVFTIQSDGSIASAGGSGTVTSVAGRSGAVTLSVADIAGAVTAVAGRTGAVTLTSADVSGVLAQSANLGDVASVPTARTNLSVTPHVTNNTALLAFTDYSKPVVRDFYSVAGDKGGASYYHSGTACSTADNGNQVTAADGGCWINQSLELTPEMYGGGNSATGAANVAAFNAAMATGKSVVCDGSYTITDRIIGVRNGSLGGHRNREGCVLAVDAATFNMSAKAVLQMCPQGAYEPGPAIHDLSITFVQPDTAVKASLNQYPPAINSDTDLVYPGTGSVCARWRANNIKITKAWNAIDMRGNSGGVNIDGVEISAFNIGFRIDGAFDITRIANVHWWPFGGLSGTPMTANQQTVFKSSSNAFEIGRVDGMTLTNCVMLGGLGLNFITSTRSTGGAWVMMNGGGFDQNTGISMLMDSTFQGSNVYFTPSTLTSDYAINQSNGRVFLSTSTIFATTASTFAPVRVSGGKFQFTDGWIDTAGVDKSSIVQTDGFMQISNTSFQRNSNTAYTTPTINLSVVNARASIMNNRTEDKGTGAGTFINVTADNYNRIIGNVGVGWTSTFPTAVNGVYQFN